MDSEISDKFISERILQELKETLQAHNTVPQTDLAKQIYSTVLKVKNILDSLDKKSLRNVAENLANTDIHFVLELYLMKSHYMMQSDEKTLTSSVTEAKATHPSTDGLIIFPLSVAVTTQVLTHLIASKTFAINLASTKILELLLSDLNVMLLPSSNPDQFKILLGIIDFLWAMSKIPATLPQFWNLCDTVLILLNVFLNYKGAFESLTTLVKSLTLFIAAEVINEETSVYLLAEESCLDFVTDILAKSLRNGEEWLNYHGVYAVDIAKCIENMACFAGLREALLEKGLIELLVSMIQIGDPYDDSSAASALNELVPTDVTVDVPVLFQGLASYSNDTPVVSQKDKEVVIRGNNLSTDKQEMATADGNHNETNAEEQQSLTEAQNTIPGTENKQEKPTDLKEELSSKEHHQSLDKEEDSARERDEKQLDAKEKERLVDCQDRRQGGLQQNETMTAPSEGKLSSNVQNLSVETNNDTGVSTIASETTASTGIVIAKIDEKLKCSAEESTDCDIAEDKEISKTAGMEDKKEENIVMNNRPSHENDRARICNKGNQVLRGDTTTTRTTDIRGTQQKSTEKHSPHESPQNTKAKNGTNQEDIAAHVRKQLENLGKEEEIKYIPITAQVQPDVIMPPKASAQMPFQHQQAGIDPISGQNLHGIHSSLIDLGVHNLYDEKLVSLLSNVLKEAKLREDGIFDILNSVPGIYSYKMLRVGSMQRQLRVVPASNAGVIAPVIHVQPEIDYHLVLKMFVFKTVPDHGSNMEFPGFTLIGPWYERIPTELEEWSFCFVTPQFAEGKMQYYLSADKLKLSFLGPIMLSFISMLMKYRLLKMKGECLEQKNLIRNGITVRKIEENGPAVTVYYFYKYLTIDYVLSLRHIQWPLCAAEWLNRQRHWPDNHTVKDIVNYGCHLVLKQPPTLPKEDPLYGMFFQYSFARAENVLLNKLNEDNPVLTECLRVLKFVCEMHFNRPQLLKSYHMQTIVLLAAERLPQSHWRLDNVVKHLLDLLDDLLHYLVAHNLPNYFIPQQNMFQQFSPYFISDVARRVSKVRRNPTKYLTPSSDPARFGIYVL